MHSQKKPTGLLTRVLLFCLITAIILAVSSGIAKAMPLPKANILSLMIALSGTLLITVLFARWEGIKLSKIGMVPDKKSAKRLLSGLFLGSFLAALPPALILMSGHVTILRSPQINLSGIASSLFLYILIACREEVAFRGYPLRTLNYAMGAWSAQAIIAVIFVVEHGVGGMVWWQAIVGPGLGAIFFGFAALKTRGLAMPIGLHTAWNFVQWVLGFKPEPGVFYVTVEKGFEDLTDWIGWLSYAIVMVLGIFFLKFWWREHLSKPLL